MQHALGPALMVIPACSLTGRIKPCQFSSEP
jgi:hypothetical protein